MPNDEVGNPNDSVSIITGGTGGIGLETARGMARDGGRIVITARSEEKGRRGVEDIGKSTHNTGVEFLLLDLASLESIRDAARTVLDRYERIDVLVNNAGVLSRTRRETDDGFELTLGVNHLGHFLFTRLLLERIEGTAAAEGPARIVNVSSTAHRRSHGLDFRDLMYRTRPYRWFEAYSDSKLANILFTQALARRMDGTGVVAHAVHPGLVRSGIARWENAGGLVWSAFTAGFLVIGVSASKGAETSLTAARAPEAGSTTGRYWEKSRIAEPTLPSDAAEMAETLWDVSSELTGLNR